MAQLTPKENCNLKVNLCQSINVQLYQHKVMNSDGPTPWRSNDIKQIPFPLWIMKQQSTFSVFHLERTKTHPTFQLSAPNNFGSESSTKRHSSQASNNRRHASVSGPLHLVKTGDGSTYPLVQHTPFSPIPTEQTCVSQDQGNYFDLCDRLQGHINDDGTAFWHNLSKEQIQHCYIKIMKD